MNLYAVWKLVLEVTSVTARQRYPWNGLVDIDVTFAASGLSTVSFEVKDTKGNTNLNARTFYVGNPEQNNRTLEVQPWQILPYSSETGEGRKELLRVIGEALPGGRKEEAEEKPEQTTE